MAAWDWAVKRKGPVRAPLTATAVEVLRNSRREVIGWLELLWAKFFITPLLVAVPAEITRLKSLRILETAKFLHAQPARLVGYDLPEPIFAQGPLLMGERMAATIEQA